MKVKYFKFRALAEDKFWNCYAVNQNGSVIVQDPANKKTWRRYIAKPTKVFFHNAGISYEIFSSTPKT